MKTALYVKFFVSLTWVLQKCISAEDICRVKAYKNAVPGSALSNHVLRVFVVDNEDQCKIKCYLERSCLSYNFGPSQAGRHTCELNDGDSVLYPHDLLPRARFVYQKAEEVCGQTVCPSESFCQYDTLRKTYKCICRTGFSSDKCEEGKGMTRRAAAKSCKELTTLLPRTSGLYWIDPDEGTRDNSFQAYCDMETDGGGWTLVYSYTFTNYDQFMTKTNAVTPIPDWIVTGLTSRTSNTAPMNETHFEGMRFDLWKLIGREVLFKSNINNWLACQPNGGSLVDWVDGSVDCRIIKSLTKVCRDVVPAFLKAGPTCGPKLRMGINDAATNFLFLNGCINYNFPTHDPCATNSNNYLKDISNPHGNVYIR